MKQYDLELNIISCILLKNELINELFIDLNCFKDPYNKRIIVILKKAWENYKKLDLTLILNDIKDSKEKDRFMNYYVDVIDLVVSPTSFYEYQQKLI